MVFAIKAHVRDPQAKTFDFVAQKTMHGGKHVAEGIARQTPRVSLSIRRAALARRPVGRRELRHLTDSKDGAPGLSDDASAFLAAFFR
jgi:hypothetical protein